MTFGNAHGYELQINYNVCVCHFYLVDISTKSRTIYCSYTVSQPITKAD
jgi:hypothetical protein